MRKAVHIARWPLLAIAWLVFIISLVLPFSRQPFVFAYLMYTPVGIILLAAFEAPFANSLALLAVSVELCFFATPLLAASISRRLWLRVFRWLALLLLLSPWAMPVGDSSQWDVNCGGRGRIG